MITIKPDKGKYLIITASLSMPNFTKLDAIPGYKRWRARELIFRPVGVNIKYILKQFPDAKWTDGAEKHLQKYQANKEIAKEVRKAKEQETLVDKTGYNYKRKPMEHQEKAFILSRHMESFGLFMEQGTGKTKVAIDTACYLHKHNKIDMMVVVAWPNGVHRNWVDYEIPLDIPAWCQYVADFWSANLTKGKQRSLERVLTAQDKLKILTFNVEAFTSPKAKKYILRCVTENRCLVIIDQSASIKNPNAKRTRFLINEISKKATYRRILDGAPVAEGAGELYSQFKFLDPLIIGHDTWTGFKAEFCKIGYFNQIEGYLNLDELHERIDGYSFRVLADECLDLPKRIYKRWVFDLSQDEKRIFDELKIQNLAYFKDEDMHEGIIEEHLAMVKNMRLQQIGSGWFPETDSIRQIIDIPSRLVALKLLLEQAEGKALIFSRFRADLDLIQDALGDEAVSYHGGVSDDDRAEAKHEFMNDDKIKYFIGQPRTAGLGHTLTQAKHVIFYTNDPSLRFREECEKRAHRKGIKHEHLIIWDLIAKETHDGKLVNALRNKKKVSEEIMRDQQSFFLVEG